jgi:hypothetical protein
MNRSILRSYRDRSGIMRPTGRFFYACEQVTAYRG